MSDKLLTEAELEKIAAASEYLGVQDNSRVQRLLADLHIYREWCQRLIENEGYDDDEVYRIVNEIRTAMGVPGR